MVKINQNNIVLALLISVILGFGLFLAPKIAGAGANYIYNSNTPVGNFYSYQYPTPIGNSYWYQTPQNAYSYPTPANTAYNYQNSYNPPAAYSYQTPYSNNTNQDKDKDEAPGTDASSLAANAVYGNSGFLPSGILQWILTAMLLLVIVILARKVFGKDKQFLSTPLKHS